MNPENPETQAGEGAHAAESSAASGASGAAASSFPFRGLAMVLITVAVLLGLWGVYALTQGDSSQDAASEQTDSQSQDSADQGAAQPAPSSAQSAPGSSSAAAPSDAADANASRNDDGAAADQGREGAGSAQPGSGAAGAAGAAGAEAAAPRAEVVNVYNNSTVQGLASNVSESLRERGYDVDVDSGNITEDQMILPENTVFFDPAVAGAEDRARELADLVGGVAQANVDNLPQEATEGGALTLVLAGEVNL